MILACFSFSVFLSIKSYNYMKRNTEKLKQARIVLKRHKNASYTHNKKR